MAFVNEEVPQDYVFDPQIFYTPVTHSALTPSWVRRWAIDHEKNIFLVQLKGEIPGGGGPKLPGVYAISFNKFVIKFKARQTSEKNRKQGVTNWEVFKIDLPSEKEKHREYFQGLIQQALQAYGNSLGNAESHVKSVKVHFNQRV